MGTKGICILVVNEDLTCKNIVTEMLQHCNYQVLHIGGVLDVLNAIWEAKETLDLVLTNAHKLESDGAVIVQHIQKKLNLSILLMCPDKRRISSKGEPFRFAAFVLNGLSKNDVNNLWQFALQKEKDKMVAACQEQQNVDRRPFMSNISVEANKTSSSIGEAVRFDTKNKRKQPLMEKNETDDDSKEDPPTAKKLRVVWTIKMHQKFLEAIEFLGYEKAVPKKIVEIMGIPGLTRENVASHLQKFRGSMKRAQETPLSSLSGSNGGKEFNALCALASPSASRLNSWQRNSTPLSYISTAKECISSTSKSLYLNRNDQFSSSERKNYGYIGGLQLSDRLGVDKSLQPRYVPKLQLSRNFRVYGDQMRNMLLSIGGNNSSEDNNNNNNNNQSSSSKFVGYRLASDGISLGFGQNLEPSNNDKMTSNQNPLMSTCCSISQQSSLLGRSSFGEASSQCQSIFATHGNENFDQSMSRNADSEGTFANAVPFQNLYENDVSVPVPAQNASTPSSIFPPDQDFSMTKSMEKVANAVLFNNLSEDDVLVQNASTPTSIFLHDHDFSSPPGSDFPVAFSEQQQHSSSPWPHEFQYLDDLVDQGEIDDVLLKGTGNTFHQFDWKEFDDTLFKNDD